MLIKLSLSDFLEVVSKSGVEKIRELKKIKKRAEYSPARDYYKKLREYIQRFHKSGKSLKDFDEPESIAKNYKKTYQYSILVDGYKRFLKDKAYTAFLPTTIEWKKNNILITISPEIGLEMDGIKYLIKLYFKKKELTKTDIDITTYIMNKALLQQKIGCHLSIAFLDIRNSKMHMDIKSSVELDLAVEAELSYISSIWHKL